MKRVFRLHFGFESEVAGLRSLRLFLTISLLFSAFGARAVIDLNSNGMSDVWEQIYNASAAATNADSDADGISNLKECIAGTNPFDSNSVPAIPMVYISGTNIVVGMTNGLGKYYQLQSCTNLSGTWSNESATVARTLPVTFPSPANVSSKYFRIVISDVDSDGDGLTDWEEYKLGLDPLNPNSNAQLDNNGNLMTDYAYSVAKLAGQNVVSIAAPDPTAVEPDAGQSATSFGTFTITRGGFPLNSITVNVGIGGPGTGFATENVDHAALPRSVVLPAGVSSQDVLLTPLANTNRAAPVVAMMKLLSGSGYTIGTPTNASVLIYPSPTPTGTGLFGQYYTNNSTNYASSTNFNSTNLMFTRIDPTVDFTWSTTSPFTNNGHFTIRWTGQVEPQYSETYYFVANTDDGVKLWVNNQLIIDAWTNKSASDLTSSIALQGGTRYNIKLENYQGTGSAVTHLSWYSPSQAKQVIPSTRLYPTNSFGGGSNAPAVVTSASTAVGFVGQPFSYNVAAANTPLSFTASNLPPGLSFNTTNGLLSGTPTLAGNYQTFVTASNAVGIGASIVNVQIFDTVSAAVTREIWTNIPGTNIADIPVNTTASLSGSFGALEGISNYGTNYGERVRGYITAPTTGNYYFWIAGSDAAELWVSNDNEPVNKVRRCYTSSPTGARQWTLQPKQKSPWLALVAGQKYYVEVLHKAGSGGNDNWSVGWLLDSTGTNTVPGGVVPGYVLSRYFQPPPAILPGTLYAANMVAQGAAISTAVGSATLRVSADGTQAVLKRSFSGLSSTMTGEHIHGDSYNGSPQGLILFDIDDATPQADGSFVWTIGPVSPLSAADIMEMIREGKTYINIHTVNYPAGEINGHFALAEGSQTFTAPPAPPAWTDDHTNAAAAARFLQQATFGPNSNDIASVQSLGYDGWINNQFALPATHHLSNVLANVSADPTTPYPGNLTFNTWWMQSVTAPDQLRQRVAFALSEIMVVSETGVLQDNARALSDYYDILLDYSFGNFRELLEAVTLSPAMGLYLDMRRNDKGDMAAGTHANENYAREIMQLFSVGLNRLWPDGTLILNSEDNLVPTYDQSVVNGFAAVFTGWNYYQTNQASGRLPVNWSPSANYTNPMVLVPTHHDLGTKRLLDNVVLPAAYGSQADSANTNFDIYCAQDLELAHDSIFYNENVGPYVCRQLIQRLVTSNPSRDYLYRVVQKFNDNGYGVRGDMQAVIKAILLDYEARSTAKLSLSTYGKQREPLLRVSAIARAFPALSTVSGTYSQSGNQNITVTTATAHRLNNNDDVYLYCIDTSSQPVPPSQAYNNVTATATNVFYVQAPGVFAANYTQSGTTITISTNSSHGLTAGQSIYLVFTSGGAPNGVYSITTVLSNLAFTVTAPDSVTRAGFCLFPKLTGGGYVTAQGTNTTVATTLEHGLHVGDSVYFNFNASGSPPDAAYQITAVPDATHFSVITPTGANGNQNSLTTLPLVAPPLTRSGNVTMQFSTWAMNTTDTGSSSSLSQTPLNSPTVFNFFFPDYKFPGALAAAALTTPEFQLTSDTSVALQMNFLEGGILTSTGNTNGLASFNGGNGAIMLDLGPWMTTNYTSQTGVSNMVESLNALLCAGQLSTAAKTSIISYVTNTTNFGYSSPPTATQMRDRVRAAVHLIVCSPDFTIQK